MTVVPKDFKFFILGYIKYVWRSLASIQNPAYAYRQYKYDKLTPYKQVLLSNPRPDARTRAILAVLANNCSPKQGSK